MIETFLYHPKKGLVTDLSIEAMEESLKDPQSLLWVDMDDFDDDEIDILTNLFNLHPLTIEDFIMPNARPKVEKFPGYMFLVMFSIEMNNSASVGRIRTNELDCCLGKNFLITVHSETVSPLVGSKDRIKKQSPQIMQGSDFLLYSILDFFVDSYFPVITEFDNFVDEMSDELFEEPNQETLRKIYLLKNDILFLRRTIGPQADLMAVIARGDYELISPSNAIYFRNIYDNLIRLNDIVGTSRDIITGAMDAYVTVISNRLNEIMKTLTIIATIMMPLTLIASIYGMNFKFMPELSSRYGYPVVLGTMALIAVCMIAYFKRKKWL